MRPRRIVVKFGTSLLTAGSDRLDLESMARLVGQVVRLRAQGHSVAVVSSGARAAGRHEVRMHRPGQPEPSRQALASIGQHKLMQTWGLLFDAYDTLIAQVLLTRRDVADRLAWLNARTTLRELLEANVVPVINENDAVALDKVLASRIGENDSLSAYVANLVEADVLVILTDVEGLYDEDPRTNPHAKLIERVERIEDVEAMASGAAGPGTGGMITKLSAARVATSAGVDVVIANGKAEDVLVRLVAGDAIGTFVPAAADRLEARKRWILGSVTRAGRLVVDPGAVEALRSRGRSLLPAGVAGIEGTFARGESVVVCGPDGSLVAVGTVNYSSDEVERIRGLNSSHIGDELGYSYGDEVIHRDNLVLQ